jgi:hypothetical protein
LNKKVNLFQRHGKGGEKQPLSNPTEQPPKLNVYPLVNATKAKKKTPTPTHKDKKKKRSSRIASPEKTKTNNY